MNLQVAFRTLFSPSQDIFKKPKKKPPITEIEVLKTSETEPKVSINVTSTTDQSRIHPDSAFKIKPRFIPLQKISKGTQKSGKWRKMCFHLLNLSHKCINNWNQLSSLYITKMLIPCKHPALSHQILFRNKTAFLFPHFYFILF